MDEFNKLTFQTLLLFIKLKFIFMNRIEIETNYNQLMQEATELLNKKEYNKVLAKIQMIRNLLRTNDMLDAVMISNLEGLHKLVLQQMQ